MVRKSIRSWGPYDTALWHTCAVLAAVRANRLEGLPQIGVPFAMQMGGCDERIFGSGEMVLSEWDAPGDGSYQHSGGFFMATGKGGLALTAGVAGMQAIGNASRRRRAAAAAQPRWLPVDHGLIHVGTHGYYLQTPNGFHPWNWESLDSAQVVDMAKVWLQGRSVNGPVSWLIDSHFAELTFVLWALARHPRHPQLIDGSWLPPNWAPWAADQGYPLPHIEVPPL